MYEMLSFRFRTCFHACDTYNILHNDIKHLREPMCYMAVFPQQDSHCVVEVKTN